MTRYTVYTLLLIETPYIKMKRKARQLNSRPIRQNRIGWRKKVIGFRGTNSYQKQKKIKGKDWEKV